MEGAAGEGNPGLEVTGLGTPTGPVPGKSSQFPDRQGAARGELGVARVEPALLPGPRPSDREQAPYSLQPSISEAARSISVLESKDLVSSSRFETYSPFSLFHLTSSRWLEDQIRQCVQKYFCKGGGSV